MKLGFKTTILISTILLDLLFINLPIYAQQTTLGSTRGELQTQDDAFISASGLGRQSPAIMIAYVIQVLLGLLGVIFIILIIYAGFMWMTSAGNEEKVGKAKNIIIAATIGLAIVLAAYIITYFVIDKLLEATGASITGLD
ncbi:MAG: hypothetical protein A3J62_01630 [Candidatus Buchananbacteria bacterium RIFCSPHIGHO2_02_FULL_38_8]|uniref:Uncharacterized protein n=2 Tax=Candidatus Buchananiibacteriota TaxID=1817903 RepID=A0A1G1XXK5_9BACT|nr:MAG: hypothetical protein A2731_03155 [Candidatus Buchananbacteria bacterium RIFCSPHIGHO2_01_FULL_39_8]OGY47272.1 MAG: hypothetical protein A3J62_01630 [Candidatus Buchananbacteria bacterium RIFCSPHIGHO2_02_FULL_38_8]